MFGKLLKWMNLSVVKVPEEIAVCEFDCNQAECLQGDWTHCEQRLKAQSRDQRDNDSRVD